jgi:hypothetical protein
MFAPLPSFATFIHADVRDGYEAVCFRDPHDRARNPDGFVLEGGTAAIEGRTPWSVQYRVAVDEQWRTTRVEASSISPSGFRTLAVEVRDGRWWVNGVERPDLVGCTDIDFEASVVTNTLAVHRIDLSSSSPVQAPAAFVRFDDLRVERVEQSYLCTERSDGRIVFDYTSTTFDFSCQLIFDASGLVMEYPGIGRRDR